MISCIQRKFCLILKLSLSIIVCANMHQAVGCDAHKTGTHDTTTAGVLQQNSASKQPKIGEWSTTIANFEIIDYNINDFKMKDSVLEALVKNSGKDMDSFIAEDKKTLRIFKVSYRVPIKLKRGKKAYEEDIVQFGLFKALNPAMQKKIDIKQSQSIPIQFKTNDPLLLIFVVKDETFSAPALLTDKVKIFKKSHKHRKKAPQS